MAAVTALVCVLGNTVPEADVTCPTLHCSCLPQCMCTHINHCCHQLRHSDIQCVPCHCQCLRYTSHTHCTSSKQRHFELGCGVCGSANSRVTTHRALATYTVTCVAYNSANITSGPCKCHIITVHTMPPAMSCAANTIATTLQHGGVCAESQTYATAPSH